jgi:putative heme-binding domain-containing protein
MPIWSRACLKARRSIVAAEVTRLTFPSLNPQLSTLNHSVRASSRRLLQFKHALSLILAGILSFAAQPKGFAAELPPAAKSDSTAIAVEALSRLKDMDLEANPGIKAALMRVIESTKGRPQFVELVRDFKLKDQDPALLDYATVHPNDSGGADAMRLILENGNLDLVKRALNGSNAAPVIEVLGNVGEKQVIPILEPLLLDLKRDTTLRQSALRGLARLRDGAAAVLKLAKEDKLPADLKLLASVELNNVRWPELKEEAAQILPLPQSQNSEALPPIPELVKRGGDPAHGEKLFFSPQVACGSCHEVNGKGVDLGPKLSEIGTKYGKDALYLSILDPNAGISFGFETWQVLMKNDDEAYGLLASETEEEIAIKAAGNIITRYKKSEIAKREKLKNSMMPTGLQQAMSTQDLVDLVEFLSTLKKAAK